MQLIQKLGRGLYYSLCGLRAAYRDWSFRIEIFGSVVFVGLLYLLWPLRAWEFVSITIVYFLILALELVNTSIERALDCLHPERHKMIGESKDVASAAVFVLLGLAGVILSVIVLARREIIFLQ